MQTDRKASGAVVVLSDLTPARHLERHIEQLDRLATLGTLAAGMAHEIKNALVAGKTFVDLLLEQHQDTELVEVVRREMGRIDALVSRMLKFAGPGRPTFTQVRLHEILDHSLRLVQPQLDGKLVSLSRSFLASPDALHGDDHQLQQAFVNLFLNALEAMGPNGTLSVTTETLLPKARLTGWQMPPPPLSFGLPSKITAPASRPRTWRACLNPSSPPNPTAPAWVCPSPGASSRSTGAPLPSTASPTRGRPSKSCSRPRAD